MFDFTMSLRSRGEDNVKGRNFGLQTKYTTLY